MNKTNDTEKENLLKKIKYNEIKALCFIENEHFLQAEKLLLKNLSVNTDSCLTYNLLIRIYSENKNYPSLIKTINLAIKNTQNKELYKTLKKLIILNELINLC